MGFSDPDTAAKGLQLAEALRLSGRLLVAYSGGVDSAYLAWAAHCAIGKNMLAVIADSPSLARTQLEDALAFANEQSIPVEVISTSELDRADYVRNDGQRCFQCKDELFTTMEALRSARGFDVIAYGVNVDDQGDFRPGQQAAELHHVAAPLLKAGLGKMEIRELAREAGLRIWTSRHQLAFLRASNTDVRLLANPSAWSSAAKTRFALWDSASFASGTMERWCASKSRARKWIGL